MMTWCADRLRAVGAGLKKRYQAFIQATAPGLKKRWAAFRQSAGPDLKAWWETFRRTVKKETKRRCPPLLWAAAAEIAERLGRLLLSVFAWMKEWLLTVLLAVLAGAAWLGSGVYLLWLARQYDGAVGGSAWFYWLLGPVYLLIAVYRAGGRREHEDSRSRWPGVVTFLFYTLLAVVLVALSSVFFDMPLRYAPELWALGAFAVVCLFAWLLVWLWRQRPFRRPRPPYSRRPRPLRGSLFAVAVLYISFACAFALFVSRTGPVPAETVKPYGEAKGGQYIGRIEGDPAEAPLGLYFFADSEHERWYYYDVLTGKPVEYRQPPSDEQAETEQPPSDGQAGQTL